MQPANPLRLGINIDHVATVRNARGGGHPCPIRAAIMAKDAGADSITAHLREDRRHIRDADIERLRHEVGLPLNLEMAMTEDMLAIALKLTPHAVCLVPEKREELTTEGGLNAALLESELTPFVKQLQDKSVRVSLFIDPASEQVEAAHRTGTRAVELHTGTYAENTASPEPLSFLQLAAKQAHALGMEVHAGHGLNFDNVAAIAAIPQVIELNIGHFLMGEAMFTGLDAAIRKMRSIMDGARA